MAKYVIGVVSDVGRPVWGEDLDAVDDADAADRATTIAGRWSASKTVLLWRDGEDEPIREMSGLAGRGGGVGGRR